MKTKKEKAAQQSGRFFFLHSEFEGVDIRGFRYWRVPTVMTAARESAVRVAK
jgi:hypothetical protein